MTRKHYRMIASALSRCFHSQDRQVIIDVLCEEFKKDNARFDRERFIKACEE